MIQFISNNRINDILLLDLEHINTIFDNKCVDVFTQINAVSSL